MLDKTEQSDRAPNPNEKPENCYCSALPKGSGLCLPCYTRWLAGSARKQSGRAGRWRNTAAAIAAVSQSSTGALRIKMHNKLAALVVLGKYLGMFDERPQNTNAVYAISDKPMTNDEWVKRYVTPH
jgi:hypothetical protein